MPELAMPTADEVAVLRSLVNGEITAVVILAVMNLWAWTYFINREKRWEQRETALVERMERLVHETNSALNNNTIALTELRAAIDGAAHNRVRR